PVDASVVTASVAAGRNLRYRGGLAGALRRRCGPVDAIVYGHWHEPVVAQAGGVLLFSPGAVCPWGSLEGGREPRPGAAGVADRAVRRFRVQLGADAMRPSVGVLEVGSGGIRPRTIALPPR
ncbi:MAG: metallophosphoesterase family protein, partial [Thermoleophilia bacterium]